MTMAPSRAVLAAAFAFTMLAAPAAFAEEGKTSAGGTSANSVNSGSDGNKADKSTQENAASADKAKQHK